MFETTEITTQIATITKDVAQTLLRQNANNRSVSPQNLANVKNSLLRGEWRLNGEAIKVARDGSLLDGQHRLIAVAETGIPIETVVISGLEPEIQATMDTGKSRTLGDVLRMRGYAQSHSLAALATGLERMDNYSLRSVVQTGNGAPVSVAQGLARVEREPGLADVVRRVARVKGILPGRIAGVLYYVFSGIDFDDAEHFFDKLQTGEGLEQGNPILALRNILFSARDQRGQKNPVWMMAVTIKAWNKFRAGEEATILRFKQGGAAPDAFPEPI